MDNRSLIGWVLRIGVAGEFAGHGFLAIGGKADWLAWITKLTGANSSLAAKLLLAVGVLDVIVALIILVKPIKPALLWAAFWGFFTALVRPLVGIGWLDFVERWANWAAPLALYILLYRRRE